MNKPVGDWTSRLAQMSKCRWRTRHTHDSQTMTDSMTDMQIRGVNFGRWPAYIKNRRKQFCRVPHGELTAKKWLDSIEKQKRRIDLKEQRDRRTDGDTDRQSQQQKIIDS